MTFSVDFCVFLWRNPRLAREVTDACAFADHQAFRPSGAP